MKNRLLSFFFPSKRPLVASAKASSASYTNVSLHGLVNQLVSGLQPLALRRDNIILNGIPNALSVFADENLLANVLRNLIGSAVNSKKNECIHVIATTAADRIMISIKGAGTYEVPGANISSGNLGSRMAA
jgi:signal transduction histidine kinase